MGLRRELTLFQATALNMIDMVGIGPFLTTAMVAATMGFGPYALLAWIAGSVLAFVDACIWSELGAKMPLAGGSYAFLRESYGADKWGRLMSFLFVWQTTFQAPLVITSAALGFSLYAGYIVPLDPTQSRIIGASLVVIIVALLYRRVGAVGKISVVLWVAVIVTLVGLIVSGLTHVRPEAVAEFWSVTTSGGAIGNLDWNMLGLATIGTVYSYLGYYNICHLGGEVRDPQRSIPRSMFVSVAGITLLYLLMQVAIYAVLPISEIATSKFVVATFFERLYGTQVAQIATGLVLIVALSSLFSLMLGYTRIPYAAAKDGLFFEVFGREHPTKNFPHVSLLVLGALGVLFSLTLSLDATIKSIITMRVFTQFIAQAVGLMVLRKRIGANAMPWRMWLYPLPIILVIIGWLAIFISAKPVAVAGGAYTLPLAQMAGIAMPIIGSVVYCILAYRQGAWPFNKEPLNPESNRGGSL
ncbi:MAG: amino acid permease [bacterium]|nr:amino acid permease [bacterium]